jgi:hypothetical protein
MAIGLARTGLVLLAMSVLWGAVDARAQRSDAEETAAARALFREGNRFLRQERWADAKDRFARAYELRESPQIAYNLTTALVELGELIRATELLRELESGEDVPRRVARAAAERREAVEPRLARLRVRVAGERESVVLRMDDGELAWAMVDVPIPVDPGTHRVVALRSEEAIAEDEATVAEGGEAELTLELPTPPPTPEEVAAAAPVEPEPEPEVEPPRRSLWWVGIVAGVVAVGLAVGLGVGLTRDGQGDPIPGTTPPVFFGDGS